MESVWSVRRFGESHLKHPLLVSVSSTVNRRVGEFVSQVTSVETGRLVGKSLMWIRSRSLLHTPYWNLLDRTCVTHRVMESVASFGEFGSVSYTPSATICLRRSAGGEVSLTRPVLETV